MAARDQAFTDFHDWVLHRADAAELRPLVEELKATEGVDSRDTIVFTNHLVTALLKAHEFEEALPLAQHALDYWQRMYGVDPETWSEADGFWPFCLLRIAMYNVAAVLQGLGRHEEAEPLHMKRLDLTQRVKGPEHPDTISCCESLGVCWFEMRKQDEAEGMLRRVLDFNTRLLGPENEEVIVSMMQLGRCLGQSGKVEEAEQMCRKALTLSIRVHGLQHKDSTFCMLHLARALERLGRYSEAEPLARRALEGFTRHVGVDHPTTRAAAGLVQAVAQAKSNTSGMGSGSSSSSSRARR